MTITLKELNKRLSKIERRPMLPENWHGEITLADHESHLDSLENRLSKLETIQTQRAFHDIARLRRRERIQKDVWNGWLIVAHVLAAWGVILTLGALLS